MQFTISTSDDTYQFEIDEAYEGWFWAWYEIGVCMFDRGFFASASEAQQDAIKWVREREEQREAAKDARGEERAGEWEWKTSRL